MPGFIKVGMIGTLNRTPDIRAKELSRPTGVPTPFKVEFAKQVCNPKQKETTLHKLLSQYTIRVNPKREFFKVSPVEVNEFFDLIDGEWWVNKTVNDEEEDEEEDEGVYVDDDEEERVKEVSGVIKNPGCRDMSKCFINGQAIRHIIGINKTWIGKYDASTNRITTEEGCVYKSLSGFVNAHHRQNGTYKNHGVNGWSCTTCDVNGEWISTYNLPCIN